MSTSRLGRRSQVHIVLPINTCNNGRTGKCEYRKCEAVCLESSWDFEFEGEGYERNRFCCDFDFCNGEGEMENEGVRTREIERPPPLPLYPP